MNLDFVSRMNRCILMPHSYPLPLRATPITHVCLPPLKQTLSSLTEEVGPLDSTGSLAHQHADRLSWLTPPHGRGSGERCRGRGWEASAILAHQAFLDWAPLLPLPFLAPGISQGGRGNVGWSWLGMPWKDPQWLSSQGGAW